MRPVINKSNRRFLMLKKLSVSIRHATFCAAWCIVMSMCADTGNPLEPMAGAGGGEFAERYPYDRRRTQSA